MSRPRQLILLGLVLSLTGDGSRGDFAELKVTRGGSN
jgi:hypothetical protein